MMNQESALARVLSELTPERLRGLLLGLAARQSAALRSSVALPAILEALGGGLNLDDGPEGWRTQLALRRAIREAVAQIPGMRYVEGDS